MQHETDPEAPRQALVILSEGLEIPQDFARLAAALQPPLALVPAAAVAPSEAVSEAVAEGGAVLALCRAPAAALAEALAAGQAPDEALAGWRRDTAELLARLRPLRRRLTLIDLDAARGAPAGLAIALAARLGLPPESPGNAARPMETHTETQADTPTDTPDPLLRLLAAACLATDPAARPLLDELEATTLPLPGGDGAAPVAEGLARLRALTAEAASRARTETDLQRQIEAMQEEAAALDAAAAAAQAEQARLRTTLAETAAERDALQAALERQAAELAEARDAQGRLAAEAAEARRAAEVLGSERDGLGQRLAAVETERAQARRAEEDAAVLRAARDALQSRCKALEQELAEARGRAETAAATRGARDAVLGAEILRVRREAAAGQAALTRAEAEIRALQTRLETPAAPEPAPEPARKSRRSGARRQASAPVEAASDATGTAGAEAGAPGADGGADGPGRAAAAGPAPRRPRKARGKGDG